MQGFNLGTEAARISAVVDDVVRLRETRRTARLRSHDGFHLGARELAPQHHPPDLALLRTIDHEYAVAPPAWIAGLHEERDHEDHVGAVCSGLPALAFRADHGVQDRLEAPARSRVAEDVLTHPLALERAARVDDSGAERRAD